MNNIYNYTINELETYFTNIDEKKYRASQIYDWLYKKRINNIELMNNINNNVKEIISSSFSFTTIELVTVEEDEDVYKLLFKLKDDNLLESVIMIHDYGISLCVSSQIGCNMGCTFCASGRLKKVRNLEPFEMVAQILLAEEYIKKRISHVVIMGIGEPFDNYENVLKFIKIINDNKGLDIGARHITISTCGIVPKIKEFTKEKLQVNLAISLHAPNNELRNKLMKINRAYPLEELMESLKEYIKITNRRLTFEYILLSGINDSKENAFELVKLLKNINCYVNLIPYNETEDSNYKRTKKEQIMIFYDILKKNKIEVTLRKEFGTKVSAACGQLRAKHTIRGDK